MQELSAEVSAKASLEGALGVNASFRASKTIGSRFLNDKWTSLSDDSWDWGAPKLYNDITAGSLDLEFLLKPSLNLDISLGLGTILGVHSSASIALKPKVEVSMEFEDARRHLLQMKRQEEYLQLEILSHQLYPGSNIDVNVTALYPHQNEQT